MKTTAILETSRRLYFDFGGDVFKTSKNYYDMTFTPVERPSSLKEWEEIGEFESLNVAKKTLVEKYYKAKAIAREEAEKLEQEMRSVIKNAQNHSPLEIWQSVRWAVRNGWGWKAADILLEDNPLSRKISEKLGSYTVTPFDDNTLLIKAGGKRYGNRRGWESVTELLDQ